MDGKDSRALARLLTLLLLSGFPAIQPAIAAESIPPRDVCGVHETALEGLTGQGQGGAFAAYTQGEKRLLIIRVDFDDLPGAPISDSDATNLIVSIRQSFLDASDHRLHFLPMDGDLEQRSEVTPVLRLPQAAAFYGTNNLFAQLRADARAAADGAGYSRFQFDFDLVTMGRVPGFAWNGLGYIGSPGAWLRNTASDLTAIHELGHNLGLNHANFWNTDGRSAIGPGASLEYGDSFDVMGAGGPNRFFNTRYRSYLGWLSAEAVLPVIADGVYRIYAQDLTNSAGLPRALRIGQGGGTNYWVEFRHQSPSNPWSRYGAQVRWGFSGNQSSLLLDMSPGSTQGRNDAPLAVGRTFSDAAYGIHLTVLGLGGTIPESLDVAVHRGAFLTNQPPSLSLLPNAAEAAVNEALEFAAVAQDPNGDELSFAWDFGDGTLGAAGPACVRAWSAPGVYMVRCTVSDLKGGRASAGLTVQIGSAPATWSIRGRVRTDRGHPLEGARVFANAGLTTHTATDGTYELTGVSAGLYDVQAAAEHYLMSHPAFSNPVRVGPSAEAIDFVAAPETGYPQVRLVPPGSAWQFWDAAIAPESAWAQPDFDAQTWPAGLAQLGYGDGDESTVLDYGGNPNAKRITAYFRHAFILPDPAAWSTLTARLLRDDGAVVYLNGEEVWRDNLPGGPILDGTVAASGVGGFDELIFRDARIPALGLRAGINVVGVEVHQHAGSSSDLSFDFALESMSVTNLPLGVALAFPTDGADFLGPTDVALVADAWAGADAAVATVEFYGDGEFLGETTQAPHGLVWPQPAFGIHRVRASAVTSDGRRYWSQPVAFTVRRILVASGSVWRYWDGGDLLNELEWAQWDYNDDEWPVGPAELGYGDNDETTVIGFGGDANYKHLTAYFRCEFEMEDAAEATDLIYRLRRDDGAVVYLNGMEQWRSNLPSEGPIGHGTVALEPVGGEDEDRVFEMTRSAAALREGRNVVGVAVHQQSPNSSDLSFDLEIQARGAKAPEPPRLLVFREDNHLRLQWQDDSSGWRLYMAGVLEPDAIHGWLFVSEGEPGSDGTRHVVMPINGAEQFFRLGR